jgi:predicted enzyme related to lactoylglutathione lyase
VPFRAARAFVPLAWWVVLTPRTARPFSSACLMRYNDVMVKRLDTMLCEVQNMDRAVAFYSAVFGLIPTLATPHWSSFKIGDVSVGLHPPFCPGELKNSGGWVFGVEVDSLRELRSVVDGLDVWVGEYREVPGGVVLDFSDPDGNRVQAIQRGVKPVDLAL